MTSGKLLPIIKSTQSAATSSLPSLSSSFKSPVILSVGTRAHLVILGVRELQWQLGGLDIEGADARLCPPEHVHAPLDAYLPLLRLHSVPVPSANVSVDSETPVVRHVVFPEILHAVERVLCGCTLIRGMCYRIRFLRVGCKE